VNLSPANATALRCYEGRRLMPKVKFISSSTEIPAGQNYVLVEYGEEYSEARHPLGLTITVARNQSKTISDLSFLTAVHSAKGIAKARGHFHDFCLQINRTGGWWRCSGGASKSNWRQ